MLSSSRLLWGTPLTRTLLFSSSLSSSSSSLVGERAFSSSSPVLAPKKKVGNMAIRMVSQAGTGYYYTTKKTPKNTPEKLVLLKHDPVVNKHVLFKEEKISRKKGKRG